MEQYESPLDEARLISVQQVTQFTSLVGTAAQIAAQRVREIREEKAAEAEMLREQRREWGERVITERHRKWAPALDNSWLSNADLVQVAEIWGDAMPVAADSPLAEEVVTKCENRLRGIHPHAMQHYDRLRKAGLQRADAMVRAAPFFARNPNIRTGYPAPRRHALGTGGADAETTATKTANPAGASEELAERRGQEIYERMVGEGITEAADLRTAMMVGTNLSSELIDEIIVRGGRAQDASAAPLPERTLITTNPAASVASDFPISVADSVKQVGRQNAGGRPFPAANRKDVHRASRPRNGV